MHHAVLSAYENRLMKHRLPWAVLFLTVPPEFVDVNVHPTKNEVRFAQSRLIHELVARGVGEALGTRNEEDILTELAPDLGTLSLSLTQRDFRDDRVPLPNRERGLVFPEIVSGEGIRIIGQVHSTYLVCESKDRLILIDQHAAHERLGFEKLKKEFESSGIERQRMLIPINFDLLPSEGEILKKYCSDLERVGLEVEFFGGNTFILRTLPTLLEGTDIVAMIRDLVESLQSFEKLTPLDEQIHEVLERMACHRQVRAGDRLTNEEIAALLDQMSEHHTPLQCPHGRPAVLQIPFDDVEKWFKRRL